MSALYTVGADNNNTAVNKAWKDGRNMYYSGGYNPVVLRWIKITCSLCTWSMHVLTVLQVSKHSLEYCRSCGDKNTVI